MTQRNRCRRCRSLAQELKICLQHNVGYAKTYAVTLKNEHWMETQLRAVQTKIAQLEQENAVLRSLLVPRRRGPRR